MIPITNGTSRFPPAIPSLPGMTQWKVPTSSWKTQRALNTYHSGQRRVGVGDPLMELPGSHMLNTHPNLLLRCFFLHVCKGALYIILSFNPHNEKGSITLILQLWKTDTERVRKLSKVTQLLSRRNPHLCYSEGHSITRIAHTSCFQLKSGFKNCFLTFTDGFKYRMIRSHWEQSALCWRPDCHEKMNLLDLFSFWEKQLLK